MERQIMSLAAKKVNSQAIPETWLKLQKELCPLRPLHSKKDHGKAVKAAVLLASQHNLNKDQQDYLESLSLVIESYEQKHFAAYTDDVTPVEVVKFLLDENGMNASDLGKLIGDRPLGWRILKGQRELSKAHILKLAEYFAVSPAVFL